MSTLYILQLEHGKWYVGKTNDVVKRYTEHKTGKGSEWTKLYRPIKMFQTRAITSEDDETNVTKEYMKKYGMDNVRGGPYCQIVLPDFVRKTLELEQKSKSDACYLCGGFDHFLKDCEMLYEYQCNHCNTSFKTEAEAKRHEDVCKKKDRLSYSQLDEQDFGACFRCGRHGHWANQCYARTTVDGEHLDSQDDDDFYSCEDSE